ncbi:MAG: thioredoxin domain-containing protein [Candidatus Falkowbacteria bacterium]|nr:thioredoxin domain-containing protein [Candidatus Falkowbacteria bacterium]
MKKPYNAFKAAQLTNALRILVFACIAAIVLMIVLYFSMAENRRQLMSWFGINEPNLSKTENKTADQNDVGLNGSVSVNESINVRPLDREDHLWGPIDAPVSLIIYDDFECPFCAQFYDTVNRAKAEFGTSLVVAVRHFPLISHDQAITAAVASECAAEKGKFWDMYNLLFEDNKAGKLKKDEIIKNAETISLEPVSFLGCLTKEKYKDKILSQKEEVKKLGVIGTPASFINNQYVPGALPYADFSYPDGTNAPGLKSLIQQKLDEFKNKK